MDKSRLSLLKKQLQSDSSKVDTISAEGASSIAHSQRSVYDLGNFSSSEVAVTRKILPKPAPTSTAAQELPPGPGPAPVSMPNSQLSTKHSYIHSTSLSDHNHTNSTISRRPIYRNPSNTLSRPLAEPSVVESASLGEHQRIPLSNSSSAALVVPREEKSPLCEVVPSSSPLVASSVANTAIVQPGSVDDNDEQLQAIAADMMKQQVSVAWQCMECKVECIPVRRESRCLCGHRLKEHGSQPAGASDIRTNSVAQKNKCLAAKCPCANFFFVVAEGALVLRCRCKHKHIEHDCASSPFYCKRCKSGSSSAASGGTNAGATCYGFDSPWVCNCGHPWATHKQSNVVRSRIEAGVQLQDMYLPGASSALRSFAMRQDGIPL